MTKDNYAIISRDYDLCNAFYATVASLMFNDVYVFVECEEFGDEWQTRPLCGYTEYDGTFAVDNFEEENRFGEIIVSIDDLTTLVDYEVLCELGKVEVFEELPITENTDGITRLVECEDLF